MKSFNGYLPILPGSRAYGVPRPDSDIDVVVFIGKVEMSVLRQTITQAGENETDAADAADSALCRRRRTLGTSPANSIPPLSGDEWKDS